MIELCSDDVQQNSRRGYPEISGNRLLLHETPQFEGHLFLPGYTIGNLAVLDSALPFMVSGNEPQLESDLQFSVVQAHGEWFMNEKFERFYEYVTTLLLAGQEFPKNDGVEVFRAGISQTTLLQTGGSSAAKAGKWHFDYPWNLMTGWWVYVANVDTTQFALEPCSDDGGVNISDKVNKIWSPNPGEVAIVDTLTAHRQPRCYRRRVARSLFSLEPAFTRKDTPRKGRLSMLNTVDIGDFDNVPVEEVLLAA